MSAEEEFDANKVRDHEIKRLREIADQAYQNCMDETLRLKTREGWHQKYTNTVLALNVLLKDSQIKDYEKRMKIIEEFGKKMR